MAAEDSQKNAKGLGEWKGGGLSVALQRSTTVRRGGGGGKCEPKFLGGTSEGKKIKTFRT